MATYDDPSCYLACARCAAPAGERCTTVVGNRYGPAGRPREAGMHRQRARAPWAPPLVQGRILDEEIADTRLRVWKRRALNGDPVDDIAAQLRMTRAALDAYVVRARKRGHPLAVYHADAAVKRAARARSLARSLTV